MPETALATPATPLSVSYTTENQQQLTITENDVRNVLGAPTATPGEIRIFLELCKARGLNPFLKEAYIVKYGDNPATIITGKDVFLKRAARNPKFQGFKAGVIVQNNTGSLERREGSMVLKNETIIGGWAEVYVDGYKTPITSEVSFDEYAGRKREGTLNQQWASKPATMIRKVSLVQALREAFPDDFGGMYDESELSGNTENAIEVEAVSVVDTAYKPTAQTTIKATTINAANPIDELRDLVRKARDIGLNPKYLTSKLEEYWGCEVSAMSREMLLRSIEIVKQEIAKANEPDELFGEDVTF